MIKKRQFTRHLPIFILTLLFLPSCKDPEKGKLGMRPLTSLIDFEESKNEVMLRVKKLSAHDCDPILGPRSQRLFKKIRKRQPIWPIQISISNNSNKLISVKNGDISLKQQSYRSVAARLRKSSFTQVFGTIASSLLIGGFLALGSILALSASGILLLTTGSLSITAPVAVIGSSALAAIPTFLLIGTPVLSTVRGIETSKGNKVIKQDIKNYALKDLIVIEPQQTADMLIFVAKPDFKEEFEVFVSNPEDASEKIKFQVFLPSTTSSFVVR